MELTVHVELEEVLKAIQHLPDEELAKVKTAIEQIQQRTEVPDPTGQRQFGTMKGLVKYMAPDFDDEMEDFKEYH